MDTPNTFTFWDGTRPVQVNDIVIITGDDDSYGRITRVTELDAYFTFTDKHGTPIDDIRPAGHEWRVDSGETRALPYADPIPNRYIAAFAPIAPLPFDEPVPAETIIEHYSGHVYFEDRVTPGSVERIVVDKIMTAIERAAKGSTELWLIHQNLVDFILPQITNRDEELVTLKARIAGLEKALRTLTRNADRDADFEDWQTGRDRS